MIGKFRHILGALIVLISFSGLKVTAQGKNSVTNFSCSDKNFAAGQLLVVMKEKPNFNGLRLKVSSNSSDKDYLDSLIDSPHQITKTYKASKSSQAKLFSLKSKSKKEKRIENFKHKISKSSFSRQYKIETDLNCQELKNLMTQLNNNKRVESVTLNYLFKLSSIFNDPNIDQQQHISIINAEQAWERATGEGVIVAVIDSGVDYNHEDLRNNIWENLDEIPGNGIDDDGNEYIDDDIGYDFGDNDNDPNDNINYHGTFVSGIIAAEANNSVGIAGIAHNAKIMPLKIQQSNEAITLDSIEKAIAYAVIEGADVINMSLGGIGFSPETLREEIRNAIDSGVVIVAAAGNDSIDASRVSPANADSRILVVGSTTDSESRSSFSNFGSIVDISAPGDFIFSAAPERLALPQPYGRDSGTSYAAPQVAATAALLLSENPSLSIEEVSERLISNASPIVTDLAIGNRLDLRNIFTEPVLRPEVSNLSVRYNEAFESLLINWDSVATDQHQVIVKNLITNSIVDSFLTSSTNTGVHITEGGPYEVSVQALGGSSSPFIPGNTIVETINVFTPVTERPVIVSPDSSFNNIEVYGDDLEVSWTHASGAARYRVIIQVVSGVDGISGGTRVFDQDHILGTSITIPNTLSPGFYRANVYTYDGLGRQAHRSKYNFKVIANGNPGNLEILGPSGLQTNRIQTVSWRPIPGAERYQVRVFARSDTSRSSTGYSQIHRSAFLDSNSYIIPFELANDIYRIRVIAYKFDPALGFFVVVTDPSNGRKVQKQNFITVVNANIAKPERPDGLEISQLNPNEEPTAFSWDFQEDAVFYKLRIDLLHEGNSERIYYHGFIIPNSAEQENRTTINHILENNRFRGSYSSIQALPKLDDGFQYRIRVFAENEHGQSLRDDRIFLNCIGSFRNYCQE